jgi:hypothetical protein
MSLRIRRLKLLVVTDRGDFVTDISFPDGLVLVRADNTSGKSTCIKAIIYALGLERMFGPANQPPLSPAMMSLLEDGADERVVIESEVFLQIENGRGDSMTIQRKVSGPSERDWRLVTVWDGVVLDSPAANLPGKDYYVRDPGAASAAAGFHKKLAEFIGWELPQVLKYDGTPVPLYIECILPLFYVEQRHGWSAIQATTPRFFQIRDVEKKAIEFLLAMDASARDMERQRLQLEENELKKCWHALREDVELVANSVAGTVRNLPPEPVARWPLEVGPIVELYVDERPTSLPEAIASYSRQLQRLDEEEIPLVEQTLVEVESQLEAAQENLRRSEFLEASLVEDIELDDTELTSLEARLSSLAEDLKKNQDVERLRRFGATSHLHVTSGTCPTCHQTVSDSLLSQQEDFPVMTVE